MPKIEWVARSMIGQWIYVVIRRRHPKLCNRLTILVSLESRGPYQHNGASLVFMRCVLLEIQLFFRFHTVMDGLLYIKSHKPDPFCSTTLIASSTHIQYAIGAAAETERIWIARLTCLLGRSNKS